MKGEEAKGESFAPCPVCENQDFRKLYVKWGHDILRCERCGLGVAKVDPQFDPAEQYGRDYFHGGRCDGYSDYTGSEAVLRSEFRRTLKHLRSSGLSKGRLLEIGCAYGFFLQEAQRYYQCVGIDVAEDAISFGRERDLDVHCGQFDEAFAAQMGRFECVVMLDVIEHVTDPRELLLSAYRSLNEGGLIMIATGDWESLVGRASGKYWRLMTPPQHLFYFSRRNLTALLRSCGFQVLSLTKPWKFVPLGLVMYQSFRRFGMDVPLIKKFNRFGVPLNLFDAMRVIAKKA